MLYLFLTYALLFNIHASPAFMGYVSNSKGEPIVGATVEITGPNYQEQAPTDVDGYGLVYLNEAITGDICMILVSAKGYVSLRDTIVFSRDTLIEYTLKRAGE
ncbi:hypothetical protein BH09BAC1_BH09BAC1_19930 [soil metagenome]